MHGKEDKGEEEQEQEEPEEEEEKKKEEENEKRLERGLTEMKFQRLVFSALRKFSGTYRLDLTIE